MKFLTFIYFRIIVYFLSYISYNRNILNFKKIINIILNRKFGEYIKIYKLNVILLMVIFLIGIFGTLYIQSELKNGRDIKLKIKTIERDIPNNQIMYIGTYLLPLISSFYKLDLIWIVVYELFIYIIYLKNINFHYMVLLGFMYRGYKITAISELNEECIEYNLYTNKNHEDLKVLLEEMVIMKELNFENEFISKKIIYLEKDNLKFREKIKIYLNSICLNIKL